MKHVTQVGAHAHKIRPLPWYGGKSGHGKAEWIAGLLPWYKDSTYVETHGGMGGVLCVREPVGCEIFNDLDSRVYNYYVQMRFHKDRFAWEVQCCPHSRELHEWASRAVDDENGDAFDRAVAFHVVALQSVAQHLSSLSWRRHFDPRVGIGRWDSERVALVAERFWNVQLENIDAVLLLERLRDVDTAVVYVDPPYWSADHTAYNVKEIDVGALTGALLAQSGRVAVSGYGDEWNHLGWRRYEFETFRLPKPNNVDFASRTEVLWTNYDAYEHGSAYQGDQKVQKAMFDV